MSTADPSRNGQDTPWRLRSGQLARFTWDLLVNREDCFGV